MFVPDQLACKPDRGHLRDAAGIETFTGCSAAEAQDFTADVARIDVKIDRVAHAHLRIIKENRFLRQPFQRRAGADLERDVLLRDMAVRLVPFRRTRCRDQRICRRADVGRDCQFIAADDAARWMQHDRMAHASTFRIQRLLHAQRAEMATLDEARGRAIGGKGERQPRRTMGRTAGRTLRGGGLIGQRDFFSSEHAALYRQVTFYVRTIHVLLNTGRDDFTARQDHERIGQRMREIEILFA